MKPNAVTDSNFDAAVLRASEPVLVDFWAEWCGPCRTIGPFLEDLATDMAGRLSVAKVNIDENPQTPMKYGVRGIPTMILFKDGQVAATKIGALPTNNPGYSFGLGFAVRQSVGVAGVVGSAGEFTWGGYAGTYFWVDPKEELVGVYMSQAPGPLNAYYRRVVRQLVYGAIED